MTACVCVTVRVPAGVCECMCVFLCACVHLCVCVCVLLCACVHLCVCVCVCVCLQIGFLSTASQRLEWKAAGLPADDLCTENAVILSRFNRYPLVIDPSGQVRRCPFAV